MHERREEELIFMVNEMAERYGMLPSQILREATTHDLQLFTIANKIKEREMKKARGESINDTYSQEELNKMYKEFKDNYGNK